MTGLSPGRFDYIGRHDEYLKRQHQAIDSPVQRTGNSGGGDDGHLQARKGEVNERHWICSADTAAGRTGTSAQLCVVRDS